MTPGRGQARVQTHPCLCGAVAPGQQARLPGTMEMLRPAVRPLPQRPWATVPGVDRGLVEERPLQAGHHRPDRPAACPPGMGCALWLVLKPTHGTRLRPPTDRPVTWWHSPGESALTAVTRCESLGSGLSAHRPPI